MKVSRTLALVFILACLVLSACNFAPAESRAVPDTSTDASAPELEDPVPSTPETTDDTPSPAQSEPMDEGDPEPSPTAASEEQGQSPSEPDQQSGVQIGPESYPEAINPLTGERVSDAAVLQDCPLLVAVSNFPPSSRERQSGLSTAAQVWETFIGDGMTRYLAVFYGDYASELQTIVENPLVESANFAIGPVRSGRVAFEDIKMLFPGATLVTAGASAEVAEQLTAVQRAYGSDADDINSAGLDAGELGGLACRHGKPSSFVGLAFNETPPEAGQAAEFFLLIYNYFNQVGWEYDAASGTYLRSQDRSDGTGELHPTLENLTGEQLAFQNVLVLFADHRYVKPTILEISLMFVDNHNGLLFRDGKVYRIKWSTLRGELRLTDSEGAPFPLKPGKTFIEVVSYQTTWDPDQLIVRYHNP